MSDGRDITCATVRESLPLRFYETADGDPRDAIGLHLNSCAACAADWEATRRALESVHAQDAFPREHEVDWAAFAHRTAARARAAEAAAGAAAGDAAVARRRLSRPGFVWGGLLAAAAALVTVVALRHGGGPVPLQPDVVPPSGTAGLLRQSVARQAAARSLREGRALLVDLMQAPVRCRRDDGTLDIAIEKERSRALLRRLALHQGALGGPEDGRIADLMGQLEGLLLQVSTLEDCAGPHSLDDLREAIRRRQILLRIDLMTRETEGGMSRA